MIKLPIDDSLPEILQIIKTKKNLILKASPGSGKTTRLPAALLKNDLGRIVVLVPKRIAAVSAADRIAEENNWTLGNEVGYHVRFEPMYNSSTQLLFMTEGVFVKKAQDPVFWSEIDFIIFDEFHERSSQLDIALGLAVERQLLFEQPQIVVMSATLNTNLLESYLPQSKTYDLAAPPFPLRLKYSIKTQRLLCDQEFYNSAISTVLMAWQENKKDVLVFLPGASEMRKLQSLLEKKLNGVPIEILHGSLKLAEQKEILQVKPSRRIILATDVAESSLTLPSVDSVVDCGLKKVAFFENKIGFSQLTLQRITKFSAQQRAGRAARTGPGTCYRLWHESDELSMSEQIKPEILKSNLQDEILTLKSCGVADVKTFSWLDRPLNKNIVSAILQLQKWKILDEHEKLTAMGAMIQRFPLNVESSLLFYKLASVGFKEQAAELIAILETADLARIFTEPQPNHQDDLTRLLSLPMGPQTEKIFKQLKHFSIPSELKEKDLRATLLAAGFELFSHRIAKRKTDSDGVSSLGRGVSLLPGLQSRKSDYYFLLAGYNATESKTDIHFAVGLTKNEFLEFSTSQIKIQKVLTVDIEKRQLYETQVKSVGQFIITESAKSPVPVERQLLNWPQTLAENGEILLKSHPHYQVFFDRLNFLLKKKEALQLLENDFSFLEDFESQILSELINYPQTIADYFLFSLDAVLLQICPESIRRLIEKLPSAIDLPSGKRTPIIYTSENAPMISVKIQDIFGWNQHPLLLDQRLPLTLELLAPNRRPTQITQNLVLFWEKSYFEIRKELRPRYPKHPWPDEPATYQHEKRK